MPPRAKFSREEITDAALSLIKERGADALTARELAKRLDCSPCPIFTVFKNMDEVLHSATLAAKALYKIYVERGLKSVPAFKGVGTQYILFSLNEPNLFRLLFMSEQKTGTNLDNVLPLVDESYEDILQSIVLGYNLPRCSAEKLYRHLWIYTHGIATLCVTKLCGFKTQEISELMSEVFTSLLKKLKEGEL